MSFFLIDLPVSRYSPPDEIRAWIRRLCEMDKEYWDDRAALDATSHAIKMAEGWLKDRAERGIEDLDDL